MADAWDEYLAKQRQASIGQAPVMQPAGGATSLLSRMFGSLSPAQPAATGGGPGSPVAPNKQGLYTPNITMQHAGPATPIDYGRMRSLLNSGALTNGGNVSDPGPTPAPVAPAPPQGSSDQHQNPWQNLLANILGGFGR